MPRFPRIEVPGLPQDLVQRGERPPAVLLHGWGSRPLPGGLARDRTALGISHESRRAAYRTPLAQALLGEDVAAIRHYVQRQQALGPPRFQHDISEMLGRRAGPGRNGRPRGVKTVL